MKSRSAPIVIVGIAALALAAGCRPKPTSPPQTATAGAPEHSPAADPLIERAGSDGERAELTRARDEIDVEARRALAARDAEIRRLTAENAALRQQLAR